MANLVEQRVHRCYVDGEKLNSFFSCLLCSPPVGDSLIFWNICYRTPVSACIHQYILRYAPKTETIYIYIYIYIYIQNESSTLFINIAILYVVMALYNKAFVTNNPIQTLISPQHNNAMHCPRGGLGFSPLSIHNRGKFYNIFPRVSLQIVPKAALKSIKLKCSETLCSFTFSMICHTTKIASVVPLPGIKPNCDSLIDSSIICELLFTKMLQNIFPRV